MTRSNIPDEHLFTENDLHLYEIQNIYTACALWLREGMEDVIATYDLVVRDMPANRNYMVLCGIEEMIEKIRKWRYSDEEISYLREIGLATSELERYLREFRFTGDLWAMPEGTIFFPGEPIVRVTAPICEGNLLTMFLMNVISSNTIFSTKIIRAVQAAKGAKVVAGGGMRAHSFESAMKGTRAGYIVGALSGFPAFYRKYNLKPPPISINAYHAVIKSFPSEIEAMRAAARLFPNNSRPMVDTYDFKQGVSNVIKVSQELKEKNGKIAAITIDSGDLYKRSVYARKEFDKAGFPHIKIILASNLDEWKIDELIKKNTPVDMFVVVTELATSSDDPKLEIVFKLAEMRDEWEVRPVAKLTKGKESWPGRKQVFRVHEDGKMVRDVIGIGNESLGKELMVKMIDRGQVIYRLPGLDEIKNDLSEQLKTLPEKYKEVERQHEYKVEVSGKLKRMLEGVREDVMKK